MRSFSWIPIYQIVIVRWLRNAVGDGLWSNPDDRTVATGMPAQTCYGKRFLIDLSARLRLPTLGSKRLCQIALSFAPVKPWLPVDLPLQLAEPEVVIGELDGPVGTAIATLTGDQSMGHSKVFAILNTDIQVRPVTLCVSKVTVKNSRYTNILMGTVQAAIANGVLGRGACRGHRRRRRPTTWASSAACG